jgi:hypothetical protein
MHDYKRMTNRWERRQAQTKQDPEDAPKKRAYKFWAV